MLMVVEKLNRCSTKNWPPIRKTQETKQQAPIKIVCLFVLNNSYVRLVTKIPKNVIGPTKAVETATNIEINNKKICTTLL